MPRIMRFALRSSFCAAMAVIASHAAAEEGAEAAKPADKIDFVRDVRPIFEAHCYKCHGPEKHEGGLRLTSHKNVMQGGDSGETLITPGAPDKSRLIQLISGGDPDVRMPPEDEGSLLSEAQVKLLTEWVRQGAPWTDSEEAAAKPTHWAWIKPARPALPKVSLDYWPRNDIDRFVLARLDREKLRPSPEADRWTLVRRVSLDLTGLPPSMEQAKAFVNDNRPDAYERLVDRLLADPAYGEHWALMWLDLARYADSRGYGGDPFRTIWRYRDWVIEAFNRNLPFDQFTIEQLAGDRLPKPNQDQLLATAFHRNAMSNNESGVDNEEYRTVAVKDRLETTMQVWMGLTMGCAKCHTHKFDPITSREYYQLYAFLNQTADANRWDEEPTIRTPTKKQEKELTEINLEIERLTRGLIGMEAAERLKPLLARKEELEKQIPSTPIFRDLAADQHRITRIMRKGSFLDQGDPVEPGVLAAFHQLPAGKPLDRLALAKWLIDRDNPLTARVTVNRFWSRIFGQGIVSTEEDFGTQGAKPNNPELLDWLAVEFTEKGWDMKQLLRTIVTSATYRQSSVVAPALAARDPANQLLARGPRLRLGAETIRDQALAVSGLLSYKQGGPSVYPPQPDGIWKFTDLTKWPGTSRGEDRYRRGLYTFARRLAPYPSMTTFDAPSREVCTLRRQPTNTPLQAFVTLNDPVYVEAAQALARRIVREGGTDGRARLSYGIQLCLARPPRAEQVDTLLELLKSESDFYRNNPAEAERLATEPLGPVPKEMNPAELAAWTVVANVLLNLDGVLTKS